MLSPRHPPARPCLMHTSFRRKRRARKPPLRTAHARGTSAAGGRGSLLFPAPPPGWSRVRCAAGLAGVRGRYRQDSPQRARGPENRGERASMGPCLFWRAGQPGEPGLGRHWSWSAGDEGKKQGFNRGCTRMFRAAAPVLPPAPAEEDHPGPAGTRKYPRSSACIRGGNPFLPLTGPDPG